jgi:uncharacterized Zn-binding protein involved in type VI secretion
MAGVARKSGKDTVDSIDGDQGSVCQTTKSGPVAWLWDIPTTQSTDVGSENVFVNGIGVVRAGDTMKPHPDGEICVPAPIDHATALDIFSVTVFANGKNIGRVGDTYTPGHTISSGSSNVFVGDVPIIDIETSDIANLPVEYSLAATKKLRQIAGRIAVFDDPPSIEETPKGYSQDLQTPTPAPAPKEVPVVTTPTETPTLAGCSSITTPDYAYRLSTNFTLGNFSKNALFSHTIKEQAGFTVSDIICNLKSLSTEVVEKMFAQYPGLRINSGFRTFTKGKSQHEKGQACDIQWAGLKNDEYMERAKWIVQNIVFDQLIFEHGNGIWLHLSFNRTVPTQRKQVLTMYKENYEPGLKLYY